MAVRCLTLCHSTVTLRCMTDEPNSKYRAEYAAEAAELALLGATDAHLAEMFEVSPRTIDRWKLAHPEFGRKLRVGKSRANLAVARSLYEQATGYEYQTQDSRLVKDAEGNETLAVVTREVHVPAKTTAATFWLRNREPELWSDVQQIQHTGLAGLLDEIMNTSRGLPNAHPTAKNHNQPTRH